MLFASLGVGKSLRQHKQDQSSLICLLLELEQHLSDDGVLAAETGYLGQSVEAEALRVCNKNGTDMRLHVARVNGKNVYFSGFSEKKKIILGVLHLC